MPENEEKEPTIAFGRLFSDRWVAIRNNTIGLSFGLWTAVGDIILKKLPAMYKESWKQIDETNKIAIEALSNRDTKTSKEWDDILSNFKEELDHAKTLPFPLNLIVNASIVVAGPILLVKERLRLVVLGAAFESAQEVKSDIPDLNILTREYWRSPEIRSIIEDYIEKHNMGDLSQSVLKAAAQNFGDLSVIFSMRNRDIIASDKDAIWRIKKQGFSDNDATKILQLRFIIPPINDIIRMAVREAFDAEAVETFELDANYPTILTELAAKQGLTEDWVKRYWRAHWVLPSIGQGFQMLWRTSFNDADMDLLMRTADISPYFRPFLKAIAHHPYTRVDVRRMYNVGVLKAEDLITAYTDLGYDAEKAANMADFTVRYEMRGETQDTINKLVWGRKEGILKTDEFTKLLTEVLPSLEDVQSLAGRVEAEIAIDYINTESARIRKFYVGRKIDENELSDKLDILNITAEGKEEKMMRWKEERQTTERSPTKGDLEKYVEGNTITTEVWHKEMERLGYSEKYRNMHLAYILAK